MDKEHIIGEIVRTAKANGGVPLGFRSFSTETGIRTADWQGKHWARWSEAVRDAGLEPNQMTSAYDDNELLGFFSSLIRELGRFPTQWDIRLKQRTDASFPNESTFRRLGSKGEIARKMIAYAESKPELKPVIDLCERVATHTPKLVEKPAADMVIGQVYLLKSGRFFKIGRSNAAGRREREIALQLPDKATMVHSINTDDPAGIESYWHRRFADKRKNGEWFALTAEDVAAFRRRKFM